MVQPIPHIRATLTGKVRGRPRRFGKGLIMQVEELIEIAGAFDTMRIPPRPGVPFEEWAERERQRIESAWRPSGTRWRDATWEDQMALAARQSP